MDDLVRCLRKPPLEAALDQNLSKLGDSLLNLIYSLSLSLAKGDPTGGRIPNTVLARAASYSSHRNLVPRRSDSHRKGDIVEAIFAYAWLKGFLEIGDGAEFIARNLSSPGRRIDREQYARALSQLMDKMLDAMGVRQDA